MRRICGSCDNSWMKFLSPSSLRSCESPVESPLTGRGEYNPHFKKGKKGRHREQQACQSHLCAQQDYRAYAPGNYVKAHGEKRSQ